MDLIDEVEMVERMADEKLVRQKEREELQRKLFKLTNLPEDRRFGLEELGMIQEILDDVDKLVEKYKGPGCAMG